MALVRLIATASRPALAELYDTLSAAVREEITPLLPADDAAAVTRATFVEVWFMARLHLTDPDVVAWIAGIARRRAGERVRDSESTARVSGGPDRTAAASDWRADLAGIHDRRVDLALAAALGQARAGDAARP
jgi:hypothetical protein